MSRLSQSVFILWLVQLVFETTVPEEVIIVKSWTSNSKHRKSRPGHRKHKTVECDADSDEEAQQLIDEADAETEQDNNAGMIQHHFVLSSLVRCCSSAIGLVTGRAVHL